MKFNDFLTESEIKELEYLEEGPKLDKAKEIGGKVVKGAGTVAGTAAKGVGAAIGGIAGLGKAFTKGVKAGYKTTSLDGGTDGADGKDGEDGADGASGGAGGAGGAGATTGGTPTPQPTPGPTPTPQPTPGPTPTPAPTPGPTPTPAPQPNDQRSGATNYKTAQEMLTGLTGQQRAQIKKMLEKEIAGLDAKKSKAQPDQQQQTQTQPNQNININVQGGDQTQNTTATNTAKSDTAKADANTAKTGSSIPKPGYGQQKPTNMTAQVGKKQSNIKPRAKTPVKKTAQPTA